MGVGGEVSNDWSRDQNCKKDLMKKINHFKPEGLKKNLKGPQGQNTD